MIELPSKKQYVKNIVINWTVEIGDIDEFPLYYNDELNEENITDMMYTWIHEQIENNVNDGNYELKINKVEEAYDND